MKIIYLLVIILFFSNSTFAQSDSLLVLARNHREKKEYATAFKFYYQNNILSEKAGKDDKLAQSYTETARLLEEWGIYGKAAEYYKKILEIHENNKPANLQLKQDFFNKKIAKCYENDKQYKQATVYYESVLQSFRKQKNLGAEVEILGILANLHNLQGEYEKGLDCNMRSFTLLETLKNKEAQAIVLNNIGFGYQKLKNYEKSLEYFEKSKNQKETLNLTHTPEYRTVLVNLAILYQGKKDFTKAKENLLKAEQLVQNDKSIENYEAADIYDLITKTFFYANEIDKAEKYSYRGLEYAEKSGNFQAQQSIYETQSLIFQSRNQNKAALEAFKKHKSLSDSILFKRLAYQDDLLKRKLVSDELEKELKILQAEQDLKKLDLKNYQLQAEKKDKEYQIEKQQKAIELAELEQGRLREQARVNSLLIEKQRQEALVQEQALALAKQNNLLKEAELNNIKIREKAQEEERKRREELIQKDKKLKEQELEQVRLTQRNQRNLFIFLATSGSGFLAVFIWAYLRKRKDNEKLQAQKKVIEENNTLLKAQKLEILEKNDELNAANEELISAVDTISLQKKELEDKNQSILDSINYAQRIQSAILPTTEQFEQTFPDSMVLYLPKDIVSGDFYWLHEVEDYIILAVMDCTGHGVPGAFMSMVGVNMLDKIVKEYAIYMPDEILTILDNLVSKAIKKENERLMDGMDGVIITIDKRKNELHFAGAKSNMYVLENQEMKVLKGDFMQVAGFSFEDATPLKEFSKQTIQIQKPFVAFLGSDGYQDQMGGDKGKKFMVKKLRELLQEIAFLDANKQKEILLQTLRSWQGNAPQTDDICIICLKWL